MSEKNCSGRLTVIKGVDVYALHTAVRKLRDENVTLWQKMVEMGGFPDIEAIERKYMLEMKADENARISKYRAALTKLRLDRWESLVTAKLIEDVSPKEVEAEVKRANPQLFA